MKTFSIIIDFASLVLSIILVYQAGWYANKKNYGSAITSLGMAFVLMILLVRSAILVN